MKKGSRKFLALPLLLLTLLLGVLVLKVFNEKLIDEDQIKRGWPGGKHGLVMSNLEKAASDIRIQMGQLIPYISYCKRIPFDLVDAYKPISSPPKGCLPLTPWHHKVVNPWKDPWGRSYQIRYHLERRKLQLRSLGRNVDDPSDDIVKETLWGNAAVIFNNEIEKCRKLSSDDKNCVFNRGWH